MADIVPDSERERLYNRWYELEVLYRDALRRGIDEEEVEKTRIMAREAWADYTDVVTNNLTGRFEGYEHPKGPH